MGQDQSQPVVLTAEDLRRFAPAPRRAIYLHRTPLQQSRAWYPSELATHEALQIGDTVHDFGADAAGKIGYSALPFSRWAAAYPVGKRCYVGRTRLTDEEITAKADAIQEGNHEYSIWSLNCQHVTRTLLYRICVGLPDCPREPVERAKQKFNDEMKYLRATYRSVGEFMAGMASRAVEAAYFPGAETRQEWGSSWMERTADEELVEIPNASLWGWAIKISAHKYIIYYTSFLRAHFQSRILV